MRWARDRDGLVTSRHDPAGRATSYAHDHAGRLASVSSDRWGTLELDRDPDGRLVALRADGVTRRWERDTGGLVAAFHQSGPGGDQTTSLVRDDAGRVIEADGPAGTARYTYDAAGQLVAALTPAGAWTWAYDEAGRLVHETGPDGATDYSYDDAHQLVSLSGPAGVTAFSYDAAGRRTEQTGPEGARALSWDGLGRLTGIDDDGRRREVDVDALGRLATFDGTTFTWDAAGPVPDLVSIGDREVVAAGGHPVGLAGPDGSVDWLGSDWRGSTAPIAGAGGRPGPTLDPWGGPTSPDGSGRSGGSGDSGESDASGGDIGLGFLGELDLGGLTWLRNRLYDPSTRAFVAPDPLPGVPGTAVATNPYHYGNNDPVGMVDPLGLQPLSIDQYNEIREQETGVQWGNIAMGALMVGSFFIPGGPIIATLVGAGMGMAPGIIQGVTTGNWDAGAIIKGGVVGGITGRLGFGMGGASSTLTGALTRGGLTGAASGASSEAYDMLPLPGSDGQFDLENVALETVIGGATGGMGHRAAPGAAPGDATFMRPNDRFAVNIANRSDVDANGYYDVIAHGSSSRIQIQTQNGPQLVDHRVAARLIQAQPDYTPGTDIRLLSCSTGADPSGFAQNLANKMNVNVQAPDDKLWAYPDGHTTIGAQPTSQTGSWNDFEPGGNVP
jgi:RHS repeat-associated protein